jgi:hypothetical protein
MAVRGEKVGRRAKLDDTAATPEAHPAAPPVRRITARRARDSEPVAPSVAIVTLLENAASAIQSCRAW